MGRNVEEIKTAPSGAFAEGAWNYLRMSAKMDATAATTAANAEMTQITVLITKRSFSVRSFEAGFLPSDEFHQPLECNNAFLNHAFSPFRSPFFRTRLLQQPAYPL